MFEHCSTFLFSFGVKKKEHLLGRTVPSSSGQLYWLTLHHVDPEMYLKVSGAEGSCYNAEKNVRRIRSLSSDHLPKGKTCRENTPIRAWNRNASWKSTFGKKK